MFDDGADAILGHGFVRETIPLTPDERAPAVATLVYRPQGPAPRGAFLYVHGYNDYFFQTWFALRMEALGFAFYALDLRRYGRSLRPGDIAAYTRDLAVYDEELDAAIWRIRHRDGQGRVCLVGHSTGGLIVSLYAHRRRREGLVTRLVLNAPFLDITGGAARRVMVDLLADTVGRAAPEHAPCRSPTTRATRGHCTPVSGAAGLGSTTWAGSGRARCRSARGGCERCVRVSVGWPAGSTYPVRSWRCAAPTRRLRASLDRAIETATWSSTSTAPWRWPRPWAPTSPQRASPAACTTCSCRRRPRASAPSTCSTRGWESASRRPAGR
ncbi:MAG: alpha/beta hydrolase [Myxococcota bacterium]